jgi:hypothetical protein
MGYVLYRIKPFLSYKVIKTLRISKKCTSKRSKNRGVSKNQTPSPKKAKHFSVETNPLRNALALICVCCVLGGSKGIESGLSKALSDK